MDPETLVSFAFRAPHHVRTVELLGSWDNFQRPYAMYHDKRRGHGFYTGCFQFDNIIFDGSEIVWTKPRSGGLKQGGTYWYYFRLDDGMEAYDDLRECTAECPLMPGQMVNIMYVPREMPESPTLRRSASVNLVGTLSQLSSLHTMNPQAKYQAPVPPPVSKVHERCISDMALNGRLEKHPRTPKDEPPSPPSSEEGLLKTGRRMFGSVGTLSRRGMSSIGSLRNMAGRAAVRARLRQDSTTYEASLINEEGECASIQPARSMHQEASRPPTRRPTADIRVPGAEFNDFSQVTAIPTPAASPTKQRHNSDNEDGNDEDDTASIGPRSIIDIQFLSTAAVAAAAAASEEKELQPPRPRLYSLHNPDQPESPIESPQEEEDPMESATQDQPSPSLAVASPTFSDTTLSTLEGDGTPSARESLVAMSYVDISGDESDAAQLRWGHALQTPDLSQQQNYRLPDGSEWPFEKHESTAALAMTGEARERSRLDAIHSELGYLGDSIH
jgi:hypothetical protein